MGAPVKGKKVRSRDGVRESKREPTLLSYFGDEAVSPDRSAHMSKIRGKDTKPEKKLRQAVWHRSARFRVHTKSLPGRPDLSNQRARVVVFVDGCFWHGCPRHFKVPKTRTKFWIEKIARNKRTRLRIRREYPKDWRVVEVFECAIAQDLAGIADKVAKDLLRPVH